MLESNSEHHQLVNEVPHLNLSSVHIQDHFLEELPVMAHPNLLCYQHHHIVLGVH